MARRCVRGGPPPTKLRRSLSKQDRTPATEVSFGSPNTGDRRGSASVVVPQRGVGAPAVRCAGRAPRPGLLRQTERDGLSLSAIGRPGAAGLADARAARLLGHADRGDDHLACRAGLLAGTPDDPELLLSGCAGGPGRTCRSGRSRRPGHAAFARLAFRPLRASRSALTLRTLFAPRAGRACYSRGPGRSGFPARSCGSRRPRRPCRSRRSLFSPRAGRTGRPRCWLAASGKQKGAHDEGERDRRAHLLDTPRSAMRRAAHRALRTPAKKCGGAREV